MVIIHRQLNDIWRNPSVSAIKIFSETIIANTDAAFAPVYVLAIVKKDEAVVKLAKPGGTYIPSLHLVFRCL